MQRINLVRCQANRYNHLAKGGKEEEETHFLQLAGKHFPSLAFNCHIRLI